MADSEDQSESPEALLDKLPEELWLKVFSYFSSYQLCQVGLTCKGFLHLSRDPSLHRKIVLLGDALGETKPLVNVISRCSLLTIISITARDDAADLILKVAEHCSQLRHLIVRYCQPLAYSVIKKVVNGCPKLNSIDLESTGFLNEKCGEVHPIDYLCNCSSSSSVIKLLPNLANLHTLNLFNCRNLQSCGLEQLSACSSLTSLNIEEVIHLSDDCVNNFLERRGSNLKHLLIDGESLTDASFGNFYKLKNLETLGISFCSNLGVGGLRAISKLKKLEFLKLRKGTELEPHHFVTSFDSGLLGSNLTYLDLSECNMLDDSGVSAIARSCPNLGTLSLNWCWEVTDLGLEHIINRCSALVSLGLCGVTRLNGDCLKDSDKLLPDLKLLDLELCANIDEELLQDLARKNLDLVIKDYYGDQVYPSNDLMIHLNLSEHDNIHFVTYGSESEEDDQFVDINPLLDAL